MREIHFVTMANVGSTAAASALGLVARVRLYKDALSPHRASWEEGLRQLAMSWVVNTIISKVIGNISKEYS